MEEQVSLETRIDAALAYMRQIVNGMTDDTLIAMCNDVLEDERFLKSPGSKGGTNHGHHAFDGGLVIHTSEVLENSILLAQAQSMVINHASLITGVIFHDYGKIFDYGPKKTNGIEYNVQRHYTLIRHLARSYAEFMKMAHKYGLDEDATNYIGHIILAHHGRKEWGSPVEPLTPEAFIIHAADHISAQCALDYYVRE